MVWSISPSPPSATIASALLGGALPYRAESFFSASCASLVSLATKAIVSKRGMTIRLDPSSRSGHYKRDEAGAQQVSGIRCGWGIDGELRAASPDLYDLSKPRRCEEGGRCAGSGSAGRPGLHIFRHEPDLIWEGR